VKNRKRRKKKKKLLSQLNKNLKIPTKRKKIILKEKIKKIRNNLNPKNYVKK
jgi:hypothetical protein